MHSLTFDQLLRVRTTTSQGRLTHSQPLAQAVDDSAVCRYNWQGLSELKGLGAKARRSLAQLGPYTWDKFQWCQFRSPKRFLQPPLLPFHRVPPPT
eukprot:1151352-Pelagomonas_calceolata.AAC.1